MTYFGKTAYKGDIVKNYEKDRIGESIWKIEQDWVENFVRSIADNNSILDIPVGTGRFLPIYAQKNITVYGFDISDDMVAIANEQLTKLPMSKAKIKLDVSDAEAIKLESNSVDYIICFRLFHLIPFEIITQIIADFYRVVKKEVVIQVFDSSLILPRHDSAFTKLRKTLSAIKQNLFAKKSPNTNTQPLTAWSHINNFTFQLDALRNQFSAVGFKKIETQFLIDNENPSTIFILTK